MGLVLVFGVMVRVSVSLDWLQSLRRCKYRWFGLQLGIQVEVVL